MFKKITLAAMAAVSVCAFAQSSTSWSSQDPGSWTFTDAKKAVSARASESINAGDAYLLSNMLDRSPSTVTNGLAYALAHNNWQAHVIAEEMAMARYPLSNTTTTVTNPDGTVTTTTTTTYTETFAENMRPMRIVMEGDAGKDISYDQALDILTSSVSSAEATQLRDWWKNRATERERDVIVRFFKANARLADRTVSYRAGW